MAVFESRGEMTRGLTPQYVARDLLPRVEERTWRLLGLGCPPTGLWWDAFPIPSLAIRPGKDPLTLRLRAIVRKRNALAQLNAPVELGTYVRKGRLRRVLDRQHPYAKLLREVSAYQDTKVVPKSEPVYGKPKPCLADRFGQKKRGRVRGSLITKCQDWVARAVAVPMGIGRHIHDVDVPRSMATKLELQEGTPVVVYRQPTLHRNSMLGFLVHITDSETADSVIGLHMAVTTGMNLDFDGDDLNIKVARSAAAKRDVLTKMLVDYNLIAPDGTPFVGSVMNTTLAAWRLSDPLERVTRKELFQMLMQFPAPRDCEAEVLSGPEAFSYCLPDGLTFEHAGVIVENGRLVSGRVTKAVLNEAGGLIASVVQLLGAVEGATWIGRFYTFMGTYITQHRGATFKLETCDEYVLSGAKGKKENLEQMRVRLGPQLNWAGQVLCDVGESLSSGLSPMNHALHIAAARDCLVDTAVQTGDTGTLQRNVTFALEGVVVNEDGLPQTATGALIDFDPVGKHLATPNTRVGLIAAAALMGPITQANLRTFHQAGKDSHLSGLSTVASLLNGTNPVLTKFKTHGVEVGREAWEAAFTDALIALGVQPYTPFVHLLGGALTYTGRFIPITWAKQCAAGTGVLKRAAFQQALRAFADAALAGESDPAVGPTECLMLGRRCAAVSQRTPAVEETHTFEPSEVPVSPSYLPTTPPPSPRAGSPSFPVWVSMEEAAAFISTATVT